ncbi:MAG: bifunctional alpha,alpha-trehalose-phosphate synthase (UDP-forming)/trehalose-phosphatase [Bacteroidetes bacterium]|nr:bifunctional alpha,alpha-trehalose-phosphate synthase (UDP-forming)/trehalose-phosphatase [Bacteroidota bacterium]
MGKCIIISNRLPVKVSRADGKYSFQPSEGGLATGLGSVYKKQNNIWIGWPGLFTDDLQQKKQISQALLEQQLFPVFLTAEEINQYYEGFSNEILWPVFHYMSTYARYENSYWEYYVSVNKKFADAVLNIYQPGDTIWIHDYHLLLLPQLIRQSKQDAVIGFFQHIPFPSFELFRLLPWRKELLEGLLGADLIGFHTYDDARHFLGAASHILSLNTSLNTVMIEDRKVAVEAFPMGIDDKKFTMLINDREVQKNIQHLKSTFSGVEMILTIDRLDYSKGILQRLQAFDLLLEHRPDWREKVSLYMIVVPSRDTVPMYRDLRNEIDKLSGNINARYRTNTWHPINYFYRSFPVEMLSALYQFANVCLVTPMRDGMNLVCKEFIASRPQSDGVLILSEMAGAAKELTDAIIVNPNNIAELSQAMIKALSMPEEDQKRSMQRMQELVRKYNVQHWASSFMQRMEDLEPATVVTPANQVSFLSSQYIRNRYVRAKKRLIMLDYDGTLVSFTTDINAASPDDALLEILQDLVDDDRNKVVIISGRPHTILEKWFGHMHIDMVAEHGVWVKKAGKNWESSLKESNTWKKQLLPILQVYSDRAPGAFTEEKSQSLAWHYRGADPATAEVKANELMRNIRYLIADQPLHILQGSKVIEIKNSGINKGKAALAYINDATYHFILAIGDDVTDEDMFMAVKAHGITVKIGNRKTEAAYNCNSYKEARQLLHSLPSRHLLSKWLDKLIHIVPYPEFGRESKK